MVAHKGNPLQRAIDDGKVKIHELLEQTGFSRSKLQRHKNGEKTPSKADRRIYAKILGTTIEALDAEWFGTPLPQGSPRPRFPIKELAAVVCSLEDFDRDQLARAIGVDVLIDMLGAAKEPPLTAVVYRDGETRSDNRQSD